MFRQVEQIKEHAMKAITVNEMFRIYWKITAREVGDRPDNFEERD
jgi:hypothetical protein